MPADTQVFNLLIPREILVQLKFSVWSGVWCRCSTQSITQKMSVSVKLSTSQYNRFCIKLADLTWEEVQECLITLKSNGWSGFSRKLDIPIHVINGKGMSMLRRNTIGDFFTFENATSEETLWSIIEKWQNKGIHISTIIEQHVGASNASGDTSSIATDTVFARSTSSMSRSVAECMNFSLSKLSHDELNLLIADVAQHRQARRNNANSIMNGIMLSTVQTPEDLEMFFVFEDNMQRAMYFSFVSDWQKCGIPVMHLVSLNEKHAAVRNNFYYRLVVFVNSFCS